MDLTFDTSFLQLYKYLFTFALGLILIISAVVIIGLMKAKKDADKQLAFIEKEIILLEECRDLLRRIADDAGHKTESGEPTEEN